ncbi:ATP-binding protein [Streptomyces sp. NBC_01471]|uniref:ATP-binding protein n=1 Tax=Streptomyces sp. NBC_01471 TaxID=2903879 RepID=UPI003248EAB4
MTRGTVVSSVTAQPLTQTARPARLFSVAFSPEQTRVARMRRVTRAFMRHWAVPEVLAENVVLCVSELVTNAIQHGHGDIGLRVRYTADELRVDVTDGNHAPALLRAAGDDDVSGRGLLLVAMLAMDWGVDNDGTTTWCVFHVAGRL